MTTFLIVWFGQLLSLIGSELTGFTLGIWVYQQHNSVTQFALIAICAMVPSIIMSPIVGVLIDRWDRRLAMLISDIGCGLTTLIIAILFATDQLTILNICILNIIASVVGSFHYPAFVATTSLLLPKHQLAKASSLNSMSNAISLLVGPALGGVLLSLIGLTGVMMVDFATLLFATATLLVVRFPTVPSQADANRTDSDTASNNTSFWSEATTAWRFIGERSGLLALLLLFCFINLFQGIILVLLTPFALSFSTPQMLGVVMSIGGLGMMVGSGLFTLTNNQRRRTHLILIFTLLMGLSIFAAGFRVSIPLFALTTFLYSLSLPLLHGSEEIIFQLKTPPQIQGRIFSFNDAVASITFSLGYLLGGPLSDYVFEPLMAANGPLASTLGAIIGAGPGRGMGLIFIVLGCLHGLLALISSHYMPLVKVETLLPDQLENKVSHEAVKV